MDEPAAESSNEELTAACAQLFGLVSASYAEVCPLLCALESQKVYVEDGCKDMVAWVVMRFSVSYDTARMLVKTAHALAGLPLLKDLLSSGQVSLEQLAPVAKVAKPETEELIASEIVGLSVAEARVFAKRLVPVKARDEKEVREARYLDFSRRGDSYALRGSLPAREGEAVLNRLERMAEGYPKNEETGRHDPFRSRLADALYELACLPDSEESDADQALVVIHTDSETLSGENESSVETQGGMFHSPEAARRECCDAHVQEVTHGPDGLSFGRSKRYPPPRLKRYLRQRDQGCRFPGCGSRRLVQRHHMWWWIKGGPTDRSNMLEICWFHHHLLHEGCWKMTGNAEGDVEFISPTGKKIRSRRPPLKEEVRERLLVFGGSAADESDGP